MNSTAYRHFVVVLVLGLVLTSGSANADQGWNPDTQFPALSPKEALKTIEVPMGYRLECIAVKLDGRNAPDCDAGHRYRCARLQTANVLEPGLDFVGLVSVEIRSPCRLRDQEKQRADTEQNKQTRSQFSSGVIA